VATNIKVDLRRGETSDRLIRRFNRKCKKEGIVKLYRKKTDCYIKPSIAKRMKSEAARREQRKLQRKRERKLFR
jgi:small subunit ribosomal protein S21